MCNWRPDSETVASRAFAHASCEKFKSFGLIILLHSQSDLVVEADWDLRPYFSNSISAAFGPEGAILSYKGFIPGFSGAFPEAVTGWTTMVVTAAVYLEFEDPNGWISN